MDTRLFRRDWQVQVQDLDISNLDIEFKVLSKLTMSGPPVPNSCVLTIWNMNKDHRTLLLKRNSPYPDASKIFGIPVKIEAGYIDRRHLIFYGDLRAVGSKNSGTDWITTISGDDSGRAFRQARINVTFIKDTQLSSVFRVICNSMGIGLGNAEDFFDLADIYGFGKTLPASMTFSGSAADAMTRITDSIGLVWSAQRGALQLQVKGKPIQNVGTGKSLDAVLISPDTGLISSPESSIDSTISLGNAAQFDPKHPKQKVKQPKPKTSAPGIVKLKTLMIPGLFVGRLIDLRSDQFNGGYMITEVEYVGQTFGNDWYCNLVARIY